MSERAQELAARFGQNSRAVITFVEQCSADDWRLVTEDERWSVGVVCRHIARGFEVHAALIRRAVTGQPMPTDYTWDAVHESNAQQAQEWADCTQEETRALLQRHSDEAIGAVRQLSDAQLDRTVLFPLAGDEPISTQQIVEAVIDHPRIHLISIHATVRGQNVGRQDGTGMATRNEARHTLTQEWFTTWEVAPGVMCIAEDQHVEEVRSYLVRGSERSLLWDAGLGIADIKREVERFVDVRPETLLMVCSHSHFDHVGDVWRFAEAGVPVYAHPAEAERIGQGMNHEKSAYWLQEKFLLGPLPTGFDPDGYIIRPATVTHLLNEGDLLDLGDRQFMVLHTPGHSPGGLCLWDAANGLLLSGDTAYAAPLYSYSPDAEPDVYRHSLRRLAALAPQVRTLLPSHDSTPIAPDLLVAMADAFDRIYDGNAADALVGQDDEAGHDHVYDLYDFGHFQVRMRAGWGRKG